MDKKNKLTVSLWMLSGGLIAVVFLISFGVYDYKDEGIILRFNSGDTDNFHVETMFIHGVRTPFEKTISIKNDWYSYSHIAGVDGVITKAIYKISDVDYEYEDGVIITAKVYKNGIEIGSCDVITSFQEQRTCEIDIKENVKSTDYITMTDQNHSDDMIFIKGVHGIVIIK